MKPNKRIEFAPFGRPTRKRRGRLLAAHRSVRTMWTVSVKDAAVISEWQRRLSEYKTKSVWLRFAFYGGLGLGAVVLMALPSELRIYVVLAEVASPKQGNEHEQSG